MAQVETKRLRLRPVETGDQDFLVELWTDERVRAFLGGPLTLTAATKKAGAVVAVDGQFLTETNPGSTAVGLCSLTTRPTGDLEVAYQLTPQAWGYGYGREAVRGLLDWAFAALSASHVVAVTQAANMASKRLLLSVGMTQVGTTREHDEDQVIHRLERPA